MTRSLVAVAAVLLLLAVCLPSALAAASAPAGAARSLSFFFEEHAKKCPSAESCNLATQEDLYQLFLTLLRYYDNKPGFTAATVSEDGKSCEVLDSSEGFNAACLLGVTAEEQQLGIVSVTSDCPVDFDLSVQTVCLGYVLSAERQLFSITNQIAGGSQNNQARECEKGGVFEISLLLRPACPMSAHSQSRPPPLPSPPQTKPRNTHAVCVMPIEKNLPPGARQIIWMNQECTRDRSALPSSLKRALAAQAESHAAAKKAAAPDPSSVLGKMTAIANSVLLLGV
jgi:hypothetical protein